MGQRKPGDGLVSKQLEGSPTVLYRWFDVNGDVLYVGITSQPAQRFDTHKAESDWWEVAVMCRLERFSTRTEALAAEATAIQSEQPLYNRAGLFVRGHNPPDPAWFCPDGTPNRWVGVGEIAARAGVVKTTVRSWQKRYPEFAALAKQLEMGPVWDWAEVEAWLRARTVRTKDGILIAAAPEQEA